MKSALVLVLISALVAAPLFADTVTMKSGETYTGEIIGQTAEYVKLKTESEVLRIELSDITSIAASRVKPDTITVRSGVIYSGKIVKITGEHVMLKMDSDVLGIPLLDVANIATPPEVEIEEALAPSMADAMAKAQEAAEAEINKGLWFAAGFFLSCAGVGIAYAVEPPSPHYYLMGKSPAYIASFTYTYKRKAENIQKTQAMVGCAVSGIACSLVSCITGSRSAAKEDGGGDGCLTPAEEEEMGQGCSEGCSDWDPPHPY